MTAQLLSERVDGTLILTISNPEARNALHPDIYAASHEALDVAARDEAIRAVIFTGADGVFCAGGNLNRLLGNRAKPPSVQAESIETLNHWIETLHAFPKPVIAAVEGPAAGAGFSLALACDFVVAASDAKFVMAYVKVGLTPDGGGSYELARMLPRQLASEFMMEGKPIDPARLAQFGIVNRVVPPGQALVEAQRLAEGLAKESPNAIRGIKALINHAGSATLTEHLAAERDSFVSALHHADAGEGIGAFLEKRKPTYR
ncbi:oxepin-CoA hydrolase, alternative type [Cupriavidus plantarum]|uniref:oxepin-CoA hydrolase, alternative type n=1 Tax=Cupriavidus plantarum TaxID=942865 RepID=UPI000E27DF2A|nr:enoyl-CoA hydratase [Cupriavidus plantarum]NYH98393.1 enoyl-CoA hydratase/carnithine racemase [Cupriavidus plantarum]REF01324.1 short chain enoyl-CoA hydratase /enoyl-CoA hydratase [Cupriavidus plantarum]RLK45817.1 short chain enoyl-CoA hydratase /enoyl-CoA hydratase [Cupriavidus plantarum]CAG2127830.1 2,3-dehydroadipyl-CoA hydratase [Cupriavidus plantarum]SMR66992.1 short chain enoyl-CoA hydratase /Enoyl-CoA hydratase [Cupriavidus plantarum]